jgi:hypothetical protein
VSNGTLQCESQCPLQCSSTSFPATLSFSQLSTQATSSLLGVHGADINTKYVSAVEMNNRVASDGSIFTIMDKVIDEMNDLLALIQSGSDRLTKIGKGMEMFREEVAGHDGWAMKFLLFDFQDFYEAYLQPARYAAFGHLKSAVSGLLDLGTLFTYASTNSYTDPEGTKWFYLSLSNVLNQLLTDMELTTYYLNTVNAVEYNYSIASYANLENLAPTMFYLSDDDQTQCKTNYSAVESQFQTLARSYT